MPKDTKNTAANNKKKPAAGGAKKAAAGAGGLDLLDNLLAKKKPAAAATSAPAKKVKGAIPVAAAAKKKAAPKQQNAPKKEKNYSNVLDDIEVEEMSAREIEDAQKKASRMDDGAEALVERKEETKAEKKRNNKIAEQLNAKFEDLLNEEAVITSQVKVQEASTDENSQVAGEQDCLRIAPFSLQFKGNMLFQETNITLATGHRYGLVGPNGCGKSTFLRNLAAKKLPGMDPNFDLLHVEQEVEGSDEIALDSVLAADEVRLKLLQEQKTLEELLQSDAQSELTDEEQRAKSKRLEDVYVELRSIRADSAPARAAKILFGLQFTVEMQHRATKEFSGGWRMRIALARALFRQPSLLLLDEPTNHLDLHAVIWLEEYLKRWKKTLIIVSHDRDFLNSVVTRIVHIDGKKLNLYRGDYDSFMNTLADKRRAVAKLYEKQQRELKNYQRAKSGDQKAGGKAKKGANKQLSDQARKQKERDYEKLKENLVEDVQDYNVVFEFPEPSHTLDYPVIQVNDVRFSYPAKEDDPEGKPREIFQNLNFAVDMESRISLVGHNGAGKSTLLGLLFGKLRPTDGTVSINPNLRIGYFAQHFADSLLMDISPVQHLSKKFPDAPYQEVRKALGKFGLAGYLHTKPIQTLSGGQKNRVVFAGIYLENPDILYLDEPTNHLDIESIEALAFALENFKGGVIVVSHDARLINAICNRIWIVGNNTVDTSFEGSIFHYRQKIIDALTEDDFE